MISLSSLSLSLSLSAMYAAGLLLTYEVILELDLIFCIHNRKVLEKVRIGRAFRNLDWVHPQAIVGLGLGLDDVGMIVLRWSWIKGRWALCIVRVTHL
jgi:hypothetical protein